MYFKIHLRTLVCFNDNTLATWCEELTHLKRPWCWERLRARGEGDDKGWDGWMASPTRWTWVWVNSGSWWWTGRPDMLQSMGSQRVGHDWETELDWINLLLNILTSSSPSLYFSCSFPQTVLYFIITNIFNVYHLNFKHSICNNTFLFWLPRFSSHLLVPLNCNHLSINHYFPSPSLTSGNAGGLLLLLLFSIKNFSSSTLLCNS